MSSSYIDPTNFSDEKNVTSLGNNQRKRIETRSLVKRFSDSTHQLSGVASARKNAYQNNYSGIYPGSDKPGEVLINKQPLSYQSTKYEDDNVRFAEKGVRIRPTNGRARDFELASKRVSRLNVYPDGTPRTGIVADLMNEEGTGSTFGKAVSDFKTMLEQGIPLRMPDGITPEQYKAMLADQLKSPGLQKLVFNEAQHKKAAEAEKKMREDELRMLFGDLKNTGDLTNDQLDELIQLTSKLSTAKDAEERKKIEEEIRLKSVEKQVYRKEQRKMNALDQVTRDLNPVFDKLEKDRIAKYAGANIEMDEKDGIVVRSGFSSAEPYSAMKFFVRVSDNPTTIILPEAVDGSLNSLLTDAWDIGLTGRDRNHQRAALYAILKSYQITKEVPSYEDIQTIETLAKDIKSSFGKKDRKSTLEDFFKEVDKKLMFTSPSPRVSPAKKPSAPAPSAPSKGKSGRRGSAKK